jgi:hypothetical protein
VHAGAKFRVIKKANIREIGENIRVKALPRQVARPIETYRGLHTLAFGRDSQFVKLGPKDSKEYIAILKTALSEKTLVRRPG